MTSTCSQYWSFTPEAIACKSAEAAVKSLAGEASGQATKAVAGSASAIEEAIEKVISRIIASSSKLFSNMTQLDSSELGAMVGKGFYNFVEGFSNSSEGREFFSKFDFHKVGSDSSEFFNEQIIGFLKGIDLKNITMQAGDEASSAWDEGFKNLDLTGRIHTVREEVTPAIDEFFVMFRENSIKQLDLIRGDAQRVIANGTRDAVLGALPWALLGVALTVATPLAVLYGYHKLKHNIGKPKLIQERNSANYFGKAYYTTTATVKGAFNAAAGFAKGYGLTGILVVTASAIATAASWANCLYQNNGSSFCSSKNSSKFKDSFDSYDDYGSDYTGGNHYSPPAPPLDFIQPIISPTFARDIRCGVTQACISSTLDDTSIASSAFYLCLGAGLLTASYRALKSVSGTLSKWLQKETKPIFEEQVKAQIDDIASAAYNQKRNGGYLENLLLYGPGGTGKTMISKYIAKNSGLNYIIMSGGDLAQYIKRGEHVTELNKLFDSANNSTGPTVIFIDEAESLCRDRDYIKDSEHMELINAFLNHTGEQSKKVMLILATNRLEDIDPAVLTRMDHKINIKPPEKQERQKILALYAPKFFSSKEVGQFFSDKQLEKIADQTAGFTGRDLFKMLNSLANKKSGSKENKLTSQMVRDIVERFVEQNKLVSEKLKQSVLKRMPG